MPEPGKNNSGYENPSRGPVCSLSGSIQQNQFKDLSVKRIQINQNNLEQKCQNNFVKDSDIQKYEEEKQFEGQQINCSNIFKQALKPNQGLKKLKDEYLEEGCVQQEQDQFEMRQPQVLVSDIGKYLQVKDSGLDYDQNEQSILLQHSNNEVLLYSWHENNEPHMLPKNNQLKIQRKSCNKQLSFKNDDVKGPKQEGVQILRNNDQNYDQMQQKNGLAKQKNECLSINVHKDQDNSIQQIQDDQIIERKEQGNISVQERQVVEIINEEINMIQEESNNESRSSQFSNINSQQQSESEGNSGSIQSDGNISDEFLNQEMPLENSLNYKLSNFMNLQLTSKAHYDKMDLSIRNLRIYLEKNWYRFQKFNYCPLQNKIVQNHQYVNIDQLSLEDIFTEKDKTLFQDQVIKKDKSIVTDLNMITKPKTREASTSIDELIKSKDAQTQVFCYKKDPNKEKVSQLTNHIIHLEKVLSQKTIHLDESKQKLIDITQLCKDQEAILLETENYLENIQYQSNMLLTLINDLLDLAKLETMNFKFNEEYFNLSEVVDQAYETMKYQAQQKQISIVQEYKISIKDENSKFYGVETNMQERRDFFSSIMGDKLRYMQILLNFLSNAIKFTNRGQKIVIRVILIEIQELKDSRTDLNWQSKECKQFSQSMNSISMDHNSFQQNSLNFYVKFAIEIEDSGVGISQENLKNIFIDFGKLNEHQSMNHQGTGLGLSICKMIVEKMRGTIDVNSTVGVGTTFQIFIQSKIKLDQEPRFIRKFKIQKSQTNNLNSSDPNDLEHDSDLNQSHQIRRMGGYLHLSSRNLLPMVDNNHLEVLSSFSFSSVFGPGILVQPDKFKLLLVNDEPFQLMVLQQIILSCKKEVELVTAINGDEAVRTIQQNMVEFHNFSSQIATNEVQQSSSLSSPKHYDAIILDLNMPIMDGYEACKQILQIYSNYNDRQLQSANNTQNYTNNETDQIPDPSHIQIKIPQQSSEKTYVERKPVLVACSAFINSKIKDKCMDIGFDFIVDTPVSQDNLLKIFNEIEARNIIYLQTKSRHNSNSFGQKISSGRSGNYIGGGPILSPDVRRLQSSHQVIISAKKRQVANNLDNFGHNMVSPVNDNQNFLLMDQSPSVSQNQFQNISFQMQNPLCSQSSELAIMNRHGKAGNRIVSHKMSYGGVGGTNGRSVAGEGHEMAKECDDESNYYVENFDIEALDNNWQDRDKVSLMQLEAQDVQSLNYELPKPNQLENHQSSFSDQVQRVIRVQNQDLDDNSDQIIS